MKSREKYSLYVQSVQMFGILYKAQFEMNKKDRCCIGVRMLNHSENIVSNFSLAFETDDYEEKYKYIHLLYAEFETLKLDTRLVRDACILKNPSTMNSISQLIGEMEESVRKWLKYVRDQKNKKNDDHKKLDLDESYMDSQEETI